MTDTMDLCLPPSKEAKQNKTKQKQANKQKNNVVEFIL